MYNINIELLLLQLFSVIVGDVCVSDNLLATVVYVHFSLASILCSSMHSIG